jgi:hypothetical protein
MVKPISYTKDIMIFILTTFLNNQCEIYAGTLTMELLFLIVNQNLTFTYDSLTN